MSEYRIFHEVDSEGNLIKGSTFAVRVLVFNNNPTDFKSRAGVSTIKNALEYIKRNNGTLAVDNERNNYER